MPGVIGEEATALLARLEARIRPLGSAVVALSGGVDSSVVLAAAARSLDLVLAVTARSPSLAAGEAEAAAAVAAHVGAPHRVIATGELTLEGYAANGRDRCFFCKDTLYGTLGDLAEREGYAAVVGGANADDLGDWRPGLRAAERHGAVQPLADAGLGKPAVRAIAAHLRLPSADKPAAACLSSRVAYGRRIDAALLARIDRAEAGIRALGFPQLRVRHFGELAKLEVPAADLDRALSEDVRDAIAAVVRREGWARVAIDLDGFRSGAMNAADGGIGRLHAL